MSGGSVVDRALELSAEWGLPLVPCLENKHPIQKEWQLREIRSLDEVEAAFTLSGVELIGVRTGLVSGIIVIDIDPRNGGEAWFRENFDRLDCRRIHRTRSDGWHLVYKAPTVPIGNSAGTLAPGVDVKGEKGQAIWWPSHDMPVVEDGVPGALPVWLFNLLTETPKRNGHDHHADQAGAFTKGSRNDAMTRFAGKLRRQGLSPEALDAALQVENRQRCSPPLSDAEVSGIAKSVGRYAPAEDSAPEAPEPLRIVAADTAVGLGTFDNPQPGVPFSVENLFPQDVALLVGPGGHGKSTLILQWAIHIILGDSIFGMRVLRPGPVVLVTAEDGVRRIRHRLHYMAQQMLLTREQVKQVAGQLHVLDMTTMSARLAHLDRSGNIVGAPLTDALIEGYRELHPAAVFLDPLVSFGPGERHVNDGEQAVITAMRRLVDGLQAPVIGAHHTGKAVAREKIIDLYSGRGGSALGDGARAAYVMELVENETVPQGLDPEDMIKHRLFRLHNVKLTDAPRWQEPLWLVRHGMNFRDVAVRRPDSGEALAANAARLCDFLKVQEREGNTFTGRALEASKEALGLSRDGVRDLVAWSLSNGWLVEVELPPDQKKGRKQTYLKAAK